MPHSRTKYVASDIKVGVDSYRANKPHLNVVCGHCHCSFIPTKQIPFENRKEWRRQKRRDPEATLSLPCPECTQKEIARITEQIREHEEILRSLMFENSCALWLMEADFHDDEPNVKQLYVNAQREDDLKYRDQKYWIEDSLYRLRKFKEKLLE